MVGISLPALLLHHWLGSRAISLVYLLTVVVLALFVGRGATLLAVTLSALLWDFFFLPPIPNLRIASGEDLFTFATYFVVAGVVGELTARIRAQEQTERRRERRATALYQLTRGMVGAANRDELVRAVVEQTAGAFEAEIAVLLTDARGSLSFHAHPAGTYEVPGPEQPAAEAAFESGQPAGRFTDQFPQAAALYVPLVSAEVRHGVLAVHLGQPREPSPGQQNLLQAFVHQIALALDRQRLREEFDRAKSLAESERLGRTLLNSVSHEIRTPLAAIQSATANLTDGPDRPLSASQQAMVGEILEATARLNRLVGHVLDISRLESGHLQLRREPCDVRDLVQVAVRETRQELAQHSLRVSVPASLGLVSLDFVLTQQALGNLLANAARHTPAGTAVEVTARREKGFLLLSVADRGPGLPSAVLPRVFDKFYRGPQAPTGGTGLGLSLAKGFIEAQGGQVQAQNRTGGGAEFTLRLPWLAGDTSSAHFPISP